MIRVRFDSTIPAMMMVVIDESQPAVILVQNPELTGHLTLTQVNTMANDLLSGVDGTFASSARARLHAVS